MGRSIESKREREKEMLSQMISFYCRRKHRCKGGLCAECDALKKYAFGRSDKCPFMETKTFCSNCKVHCYKAEMRNRIRDVMRFSGPRILMYHPYDALRHAFETYREKRRMKNEK
ncbi:MAG: nitrous oxide-stimulated promoter family protein [Oscillospiraceae bacterium]|nr:nitrous oxide-stimulated promoter family protein [Oscillospiraceae bacterium]